MADQEDGNTYLQRYFRFSGGRNLLKTDFYSSSPNDWGTYVYVVTDEGQVLHYLEQPPWNPFGPSGNDAYLYAFEFPDSSIGININAGRPDGPGFFIIFGLLRKLTPGEDPLDISFFNFLIQDMATALSDGSMAGAAYFTHLSRFEFIDDQPFELWHNIIELDPYHDLSSNGFDEIALPTTEGIHLFDTAGNLLIEASEYRPTNLHFLPDNRLLAWNEDTLFLFSDNLELLGMNAQFQKIYSADMLGSMAVTLIDKELLVFYDDTLGVIDSISLPTFGEYTQLRLTEQGIMLAGTECYGTYEWGK